MQITRAGSKASVKGPADWFTGTVRLDPLTEAQPPAHVGTGQVTFEPGARTAWHTHPLGQTIIITSGAGQVQREGGPVEQVRPGDVVFFEPGEKHWHGARPETAMTHIAVTEALDGKAVERLPTRNTGTSDIEALPRWPRSEPGSQPHTEASCRKVLLRPLEFSGFLVPATGVRRVWGAGPSSTSATRRQAGRC